MLSHFFNQLLKELINSNSTLPYKESESLNKIVISPVTYLKKKEVSRSLKFFKNTNQTFKISKKKGKTSVSCQSNLPFWLKFKNGGKKCKQKGNLTRFTVNLTQ